MPTNVARFCRELPSSIISSRTIWHAVSGNISSSGSSIAEPTSHPATVEQRIRLRPHLAARGGFAWGAASGMELSLVVGTAWNRAVATATLPDALAAEPVDP